MSHKVHPKSFRIRGMKDWASRGFYEKDFASYLEEDFEIREFIEKRIKKFGLDGIEIERSLSKVNIVISTARPGLVIGRAGEGVERLKRELKQRLLKVKSSSYKNKALKTELKIEIREIKNVWLSAPIVAQFMAAQIKKRTAFRRVLKSTLSKVIGQKGVKGARLEVSGRLNGVSIARREWLQQGLLPRQTLRADIDYARDTAFCGYGSVGIKVWIYKGEKFE
jgi:small subunit ribosomal protein S3